MMKRYRAYIAVFAGLYIVFVVFLESQLHHKDHHAKPRAPPVGKLQNEEAISKGSRVQQRKILKKSENKWMSGNTFVGRSSQEPRTKHYFQDSTKFPHAKKCDGQCHPGFAPIIGTEHYIYSTYYDDRFSNPVLTMFVLLRRNTQDRYHCVFYQDKDTATLTDVYQHEMTENHLMLYGSYTFTCKVPDRANLCHVGLGKRHKLTNQVETVANLCIQKQSQFELRGQFQVCLSPIYGNIAPATLVQYIELSRILGADHIHMYVMKDLYDTTMSVINYYNRTDYVSMVTWSLPVTEDEIWSRGQQLAMNDCLYRNMYGAKYTMFLDIDEIIVPRGKLKGGNLSDITEHAQTLKHHKTNKALVFDSFFFDPELREEGSDVYFVNRNRRTRTSTKMRRKVLVESDKILDMGIHHVNKFVDDMYGSVEIGEDCAFVHHYRECSRDFDKSVICEDTVNDDTLWRYEEAVWKRYRNIMDEIHRTLVD